MTQQLLVLQGLPASGKTIWAKKLLDLEPGKWKRVNKDELRRMLDAGRWSNSNEQFIDKIQDILIRQALNTGLNVVVDNTNLRAKTITHLASFANSTTVVEFKFFDTPLEECLLRDSNRLNSVGSAVIRDMWQRFLKNREHLYPSQQVSFSNLTETIDVSRTFDLTRPITIICDIDGTLALLNGRHIYDASLVHTDLVNKPVYWLLESLYTRYKKSNLKIIFVSGRDEQFRPETEAWLQKNNILYSNLYMRPKGDKRQDALVKKEIFEKYLKDLNIAFVLDDRQRVVNMWRSLGLTVFQVAEGNF